MGEEAAKRTASVLLLPTGTLPHLIPTTSPHLVGRAVTHLSDGENGSERSTASSDLVNDRPSIRNSLTPQ